MIKKRTICTVQFFLWVKMRCQRSSTLIIHSPCGQKSDRKGDCPEIDRWRSFNFWSWGGPKPDQNSGWPKTVTHCYCGVSSDTSGDVSVCVVSIWINPFRSGGVVALAFRWGLRWCNNRACLLQRKVSDSLYLPQLRHFSFPLKLLRHEIVNPSCGRVAMTVDVCDLCWLTCRLFRVLCSLTSKKSRP